MDTKSTCLQTINLFSGMSDGNNKRDSLKKSRKFFENFPPLTFSEERTLLEKAQKGNKKASERLFYCNYRFALSIAYKYLNKKKIHFCLGIEEAALNGLHLAIKKFNLDKKNRFSTYAFFWILREISKCFIKENTWGKDLRLDTISENNFLIYEESFFERFENSEDIQSCLNRLPEKDRDTIIKYFWEGCSLEKIGNIFGVSKEAVRCRLNRIKNILKRMLTDGEY